MKVHKSTFAECNQPGSIWTAVAMAKHEHQNYLRYKREKAWMHQDYSRGQRDTMMHTIRIIARGLLVTMQRGQRKANRSISPSPLPA